MMLANLGIWEVSKPLVSLGVKYLLLTVSMAQPSLLVCVCQLICQHTFYLSGMLVLVWPLVSSFPLPLSLPPGDPFSQSPSFSCMITDCTANFLRWGGGAGRKVESWGKVYWKWGWHFQTSIIFQTYYYKKMGLFSF